LRQGCGQPVRGGQACQFDGYGFVVFRHLAPNA
jgi:hypothetical protein